MPVLRPLTLHGPYRPLTAQRQWKAIRQSKHAACLARDALPYCQLADSNCMGQPAQDIVDAVPDNSTDGTQRIRTLYTPDGSPSKQPVEASRSATGARKKQHSTPPIKDVRCSSLCAPAPSMPVYPACRVQAPEAEALLNIALPAWRRSGS